MYTNEVLIMTGTINVGKTPYVAIRDSQERLLQYLYSLVSWIKLTNITTIVFCENSNTNYDFKKLIEFSETEGKDLEVLVFDDNYAAQKHGKGFGEGIIMEYAIQNSKSLTMATTFYKVTGRLFIQNFESIQKKHIQFDNVFKCPGYLLEEDKRLWHPRSLAQNYRMYLFSLRYRGFRNPHYLNNHVSTFFYKSNIDFFKQELMPLYKKTNDTIPYWVEHAYCDALQGKFQIMLEEPRVVGRSGSSGNLINGLDYDEEIKKIAKDFLI